MERFSFLKPQPSLTVYAFPGGTQGYNPYLDSLEQALEEVDSSVVVDDRSLTAFDVGLLFRQHPGRIIVHIHWITEYSRLGNPWWRDLWLYFRTILSFLLISIMKARHNASVVWTVHNADQFHARPFWTSLFHRWTIWLSDAYIFHCSKARDDFFTRHHNKPAFIIPHGSFVNVYGPLLEDRQQAKRFLGISDNVVTFLILGWVKRAKNLEWMLDALQSLPHRNVRFIIAGAPATKGDLLLPLEYAGDERFIFINRFIPDHQLRWLMAGADYLLNAQMRGYTSGASITALSYGLPVLSIDWGCMSSLIKHGRNGFLFTRDDFYEVIDQAIATCQYRDRYLRLRRYAEQSIQHLSWSTIAKKTLQAYERVFELPGIPQKIVSKVPRPVHETEE